MKSSILAAIVAASVLPAGAASISLASVMDGGSYFSEDAVTGAFAMIRHGNGSLGSAGANTGDADGLYPIANVGQSNPGTLLGSPLDFFPREANFQVGSISYDESGITGIGTETVPITSIDLSAFWAPDPNRTGGTPGAPPTVVSDISDYAIGLWFFGGDGGISFGALDAADTVTFTNGLLTSIELELSTAFSVITFGAPFVWDGTFRISGDQLSYSISDVASTFIGPSRLTADLRGTVTAVVPEPSAFALAGLAGLALISRRRRA